MANFQPTTKQEVYAIINGNDKLLTLLFVAEPSVQREPPSVHRLQVLSLVSA
jgi:hypothetical protein